MKRRYLYKIVYAFESRGYSLHSLGNDGWEIMDCPDNIPLEGIVNSLEILGAIKVEEYNKSQHIRVLLYAL